MKRKYIGFSVVPRSAALMLMAFVATWFAPAAFGRSLSLPDPPMDVAPLFISGHYQQAIETLQGDVKRSPQDASLHYWLGRCYYELRDYTQAIVSLERAVELDPKRSQYHDSLGKAYGRKAEEAGRLSAFSAFSLARKTHREFEEAVRLDASDLEAQRDLIRYLFNAPGIVGGGDDRAQEQIQALSGVDAVEGQLARAEYLASKKKFGPATAEYEKVMDSNPSREGVYFEIAEYFRDVEDGSHMMQAVEAAQKAAPHDARLQYYRGVALVLSKGNLDDARKLLRAYVDTVPENSDFPSHASAYEWLGRLFEAQGRPDKAAEVYQAGLALEPRNRTLQEALKRLHKN